MGNYLSPLYRMMGIYRRFLLILSALLVLSACASLQYEPTAPGLGVPRISNFRFEPSSIRVRERAELIFDFEDSLGDIGEGYLLESGIRELQWMTGLESIPLDMRELKGKVFGTYRQTRTWQAEGIYIYELYVVDAKGNKSNKLRARIVVY